MFFFFSYFVCLLVVDPCVDGTLRATQNKKNKSNKINKTKQKELYPTKYKEI